MGRGMPDPVQRADEALAELGEWGDCDLSVWTDAATALRDLREHVGTLIDPKDVSSVHFHDGQSVVPAASGGWSHVDGVALEVRGRYDDIREAIQAAREAGK